MIKLLHVRSDKKARKEGTKNHFWSWIDKAHLVQYKEESKTSALWTRCFRQCFLGRKCRQRHRSDMTELKTWTLGLKYERKAGLTSKSNIQILILCMRQNKTHACANSNPITCPEKKGHIQPFYPISATGIFRDSGRAYATNGYLPTLNTLHTLPCDVSVWKVLIRWFV